MHRQPSLVRKDSASRVAALHFLEAGKVQIPSHRVSRTQRSAPTASEIAPTIWQIPGEIEAKGNTDGIIFRCSWCQHLDF